MADQFPNGAKRSFTEGEVRRGVELLYFGYSHLTRSIDAGLATQGLGRAHHRALYFIARQPDLTVSHLLKLLNVTKQSLGRVINELIARGLIENSAGQADRRQRHLRLTEQGRALEADLFGQLQARLVAAYRHGDGNGVAGFWEVLEGLVPLDERARVFALQG